MVMHVHPASIIFCVEKKVKRKETNHLFGKSHRDELKRKVTFETINGVASKLLQHTHSIIIQQLQCDDNEGTT